ncbi:glycosyltransferase family 2 protein [Pedobacter duraquae]|uniref:Glycosyl transferase family 2 n=1 Tax=Pedobacter duraquae TaxID=425511 RepID=A0A4R6IDG9_9SPHI|nr:glycosyltransferase family A protein [Pedobacter duraquae]TDO19736.1 glycosyl transferase family 2 [Pedobacter duraquae]
MIIFTYVVLFFLVIRFSVTLFNFLSNPKLPHFRQRLDGLVSVVIQVKNEESNLLNLLEALRQQDYRNLEIIISHAGLDLTDPALSDPQLRFVAQPEANTDVSLLAPYANGDYMLLLDSNTTIQKGFIYSLIYRAEVFNQPVIAIIPNQNPKGILQKLLLPLQDFVLLNLIPLRVIKMLKGVTLVGLRKDCLFFKAAAFENYSTLAFPVEVLLANKMAWSTNGQDRERILNNATSVFKRNMAGNLLSAILYVFLVVAGPIIIGFGVDPYLLILPAGLIFLTRVMVSFLTAQHPVRNLLLHPLQMVMLGVLLMRAISKQLLTRGQHKR